MDTFDELPAHIRNKITCTGIRTPEAVLDMGTMSAPDTVLDMGTVSAPDTVSGTADDRDVCWCWTGSYQRPRVRHRPYTHEGDHEIFRHTSGRNIRERGLPMIRSPELGYAVPAHRQVYAVWSGRPLRTVPRLQRCYNDRCVRPSHTVELDPVPERARGRSKAGMPTASAEDPPPPLKDVWKALTAPDGPSNQLPKAEVELEIGMPISDAMWQRFQDWDDPNDNDNDDE